MRFRPET